MLRLTLVLVLLSAVCSQTNAFSSIVAFGDSLTDDCTMGTAQVVEEALNTQQLFPGAPYLNGCIYSSGPPYPVVAAGILNMSLTDYAKGGATSGAVQGAVEVPAGFANLAKPVPVLVPSTIDQVADYLEANNGTASPDAIYILFIGANDYLNTLGGLANATAEEVLEATAEALDMLYQAGARVLYTQLLPYLGNTPRLTAAGPQAVAVANAITTEHNNALAELLPAFAADHLDASVILFNFEAFLVQLSANATALGITDTTTPCYTGAVAGSATTLANVSAVCANPNNHAYWDGVHPTGRVHELWGQAVAAQLAPFASPSSGSSSSRKLLAERDNLEGSHMGGIWVYGQPL